MTNTNNAVITLIQLCNQSCLHIWPDFPLWTEEGLLNWNNSVNLYNHTFS